MKTRLSIFFTVGCLALFTDTSFAFTLTERPAYNDYTNAVSMGTWCGKAVEERGVVVGDTNAFLPKTSSQQGIVINVKQNIQSRYPSYIRPGIADVPGVLNTFGVDGLKWSNDVAFLTYCGLAANSFSSTPYFALQVPASSNGWYSVKGCLTNMFLTYGSAFYSVSGEQPSYWHGFFGDEWGNAYYDTWIKATGFTESDWAIDNWSWLGYPTRLSLGISYSPGCDTALLINDCWCLGYNYAPESICRTADVYHKAGAPQEYPEADNVSVFDPQNTSVSNGWWKVGTLPETNSTFVAGIDVGINGYSGDPGMPSWCSEPFNIGATPQICQLGWETKDQLIVLCWTGFQYK